MTGNESPEDGHEGHHGDKPKGVVRKEKMHTEALIVTKVAML
jgi:hypothetical protein